MEERIRLIGHNVVRNVRRSEVSSYIKLGYKVYTPPDGIKQELPKEEKPITNPFEGLPQNPVNTNQWDYSQAAQGFQQPTQQTPNINPQYPQQ